MGFGLWGLGFIVVAVEEQRMNNWLVERRWMIAAWCGSMAVGRALGYEYAWAFLVAVALIVLVRDLWGLKRADA